MTKFVAIINTPGYLPDSDESPPAFDTAAEAWRYLIGELESADGGWVPADESDPTGPHDRSPTALDMERMVDAHDPIGTVYGATPGYDGDHDLGVAYSVDIADDEESET